MNRLPIIAIVVPCFNEEQALPVSVPQMLSILDGLVGEKQISDQSYLLLCNDGSRDDTWGVID